MPMIMILVEKPPMLELLVKLNLSHLRLPMQANWMVCLQLAKKFKKKFDNFFRMDIYKKQRV